MDIYYLSWLQLAYCAAALLIAYGLRGMATPVFVMYREARKLAKDASRATMSAMLLTPAVVRGIGYWAVDEFSARHSSCSPPRFR